MHKIGKFLRTLDPGLRLEVESLIARTQKKDFAGLDVKKLKGFDHLFRLKKGKIRIIFAVDESGEVIVLEAVRRSDTTYNL